MKHLLYIGNKLSKHGATPTTIEVLGPLLEQEGHAVSYSSSQKNRYLRMFSMVCSVFLNRKVAYVLIDTYSTTNFWYAFATSQLCRSLGLKYIPILHGGNLPRRIKKNPRFCKMIFDHSHRNVAPSSYLMEQFKEQGFLNLICIPNVIEIESYPFKERKKASPKLLWVRAFSEIYHPVLAVEVFYEIKKRYPKATLCMVGPDKDGSLVKTKERAKELGLEVVFTGKLTKPEWISLSKDYDIFINTTHFDNTPISVIEAMGLGLAVVSTNVGGIPFLLEHNTNALLVPDNGVKEMVASVEKLVENRDLYVKLTQTARSKTAGFDWANIKQKWTEIIQ